MKIVALSALLLLAAPITPLAAQQTLSYTISGTGSGALNGTSFSNANFQFILTGDASNLSGGVLDPLNSATVNIDGYGEVTLSVPTRLGVNQGIVFFGKTGTSNADLFDFFTSGIDLSESFGPVTGTGVFALGQFTNVVTTGGALTLSSSSDVQFQSLSSSSVPEPAAWALMITGFGAIGIALRFRRRSQWAPAF